MNGKGYREDLWDSRDARASDRLGASGSAPTGTKPSMMRFRPRRLRQGGANTCVAFAITGALACLASAEVNPDGGFALSDEEIAAPTFLYQNALKQEYAGSNPHTTVIPLLDDGCRPRMAMQAGRELGIVSWATLPYDAGQVLKKIPPDVYQDAFDRRGFLYHRVYSTGDDRLREVAEGFRRGMACVYGMRVDRAFEEHTGEDPVDSINLADDQGGHMLMGLEVDEATGDLISDNWWADWGYDDGLFRMTGGLFGSPIVQDVYLIERAVPFR